MAVLVKGMEMPKSCYVCPFCDYVSARCDAVRGTPYTPASRYEERADFCPLVPVPPHGRLGDLDALMGRIEHDTPLSSTFEKIVRRYIENTPTIIPANEEAE